MYLASNPYSKCAAVGRPPGFTLPENPAAVLLELELPPPWTNGLLAAAAIAAESVTVPLFAVLLARTMVTVIV